MNKYLKQLILLLYGFDEAAKRDKLLALIKLSKQPLKANPNLITYHDALLFLLTYPSSKKEYLLAQKELSRITVFCSNNKLYNTVAFNYTGLPFTLINSRFTPTFLSWLISQKNIKTTFDCFYQPQISLNQFLNISLTPLLKTETTAGLSNTDLLDALGVKQKDILPFMINQFNQGLSKIQAEFFMEQINLYVNVVGNNKHFSRTYNFFKSGTHLFFHTQILKQFNHRELINQSLPSPLNLTQTQINNLVNVLKTSMALTARETDPITYINPNTIRYFALERGVAVVLYGMYNNCDLPLESYVGFTLFKNNYPVSYGGAWIFGKRAKFGMNVFEAFRGGESGFTMCQLLRVYKQFFELEYIEVEPYQFGLDNPDGIKTGAFWFYYKYGFRPVNTTLHKLANKEFTKVKNKKGYRTPEKVLIQFTQSNVALNLSNKIPLSVFDISEKVKKHLTKHQLKPVKEVFLKKMYGSIADDFNQWVNAFGIKNKDIIFQMQELVELKHTDLYAYQNKLRLFISKWFTSSI